jgi:hypothetical protein
MREPAVTLTDFWLAAECAVCAALLGFAPARKNGRRTGSVGYFVFQGLAAAAGGTVHGYCSDMQMPECLLLWQLTLLSIGLAAFFGWMLAAGLLATGNAGRWLVLLAVPQIAVYATMVVLVTQQFWIVFTIYLPAALLLLAAFCRGGWNGHRFLAVGAIGLILSFLSSFVQFMRIGIHPEYFNHNALAHVIQAIALVLIFLGMRSVVGSDDFAPAL